MSLVNDLLIKLDRQSEETERASSSFPGNTSARQRVRSSSRSNLIRLLPVVGIGLTLLLIAAGLGMIVDWPAAEVRHSIPPVSARPAPGQVGAFRGVQPPVESAPPLSGARPSQAARSKLLVERPPTLRSVHVENGPNSTRLTLATNGVVDPQIQPHDNERGLDVFLGSTRLTAPIDELDLTRTPIRSVATQADENGLRIALKFDPGVRFLSQSHTTSEGTTLVLDLQSAPAIDVATRRIEPEIRVEPIQTPRSTARLQRVEWDAGEVLGGAEADSPAEALNITRSASDRIRIDRNAALDHATEELTAARFARSEGNVEEADRRFASAIAFFPNYREAIIEWASLLGEAGRIDEAIDLIRSARRADSRDPTLTMLHAHLLESSDRRSEAIELLDRAGFSLTEAPDVYALAAAYLQRAGQHTRAIERYETMIRRYPQKAQWWMGLGISLEATKRQSEAADVYQIAMQIGDLPRPTTGWISGRLEALREKE